MKSCFILFITRFPLLPFFLSSCCLSAIRLRGWIRKGGKRAQFVSRKYWFALLPVVMYCPFLVLFFFMFDFSLFFSYFSFLAHIFSCLHVTCASQVWEIPVCLAPGTLSAHTYITFWCVLQRQADGATFEKCAKNLTDSFHLFRADKRWEKEDQFCLSTSQVFDVCMSYRSVKNLQMQLV